MGFSMKPRRNALLFQRRLVLYIMLTRPRKRLRLSRIRTTQGRKIIKRSLQNISLINVSWVENMMLRLMVPLCHGYLGFIKNNEAFDVWRAREEIVAFGVNDAVFFEK